MQSFIVSNTPSATMRRQWGMEKSEMQRRHVLFQEEGKDSYVGTLLDGKTQRRSHDRKRGLKALHMVSAWASRNGVVLGQVKTEEKSNEITAMPVLLEKLELSGSIVTIDAMGCQREIVKQIKEGGGDYVLTVKGNQIQLEKEIEEYFEEAEEDDFDRSEIQNEETSDEGHGRVEHRSYFLSTDLNGLSGVEKWCGVTARPVFASV